MRLVNASLPFKIVYALYHHEYLGYLISPHVVQLLPNGELSLVHQGISPGNMSQFAKNLTSTDEALIPLLHEISPKAIAKRFGGKPRELTAFFTTKFKGQVKELAVAYVQRRLARVIPQLSASLVYEMAHDGYPAHERIEVSETKASVLFHFRRKDTFTRYYPTIKLGDEKLDFRSSASAIICNEPAWVLLKGKLISFKNGMDGKKLKPFLKKDFIIIPREKEEEYYQKFVRRIIEKYDVFAKGFEIRTIRAVPSFSLEVNNHPNSFSFIPKVSYNRFEMRLFTEGKVKAFLEKKGDRYVFYRVERTCQQEKELRQFLESIHPNKHSLTPWEYVGREVGLNWLSANMEKLEAQGIRIIQHNPEQTLNLSRPEIEMTTRPNGDWFDIRAIVKIGRYEIPFVKFRSHILKNKREYRLPDGTVAILPEEWFSDYRHLMEVSKASNGELMRIRTYQAPLLNLPVAGKDLMQNLQALQGMDRVPAAPPPINIKATLRKYQAQGYDWLVFLKQHKMGGILADDMGLGKTLQTLSLMQAEKEAGNTTPSLVVMPTSLIYNWKNEAAKFTPQLQVHIHTGINRSKDPQAFEGYDLVLSTYGIVRQDVDLLKNFPFHYIILDEGQMIKNPESKTAQAIRLLKSRHRLSLTGTPIENTVMDIWSQMAFLNPGLLGGETFFKKFYVTPIEKEQDEVRSAKLKRIINPFILRRKKHQVEQELPPKVEKLHYCEMEEAQQQLYEETRSAYRNYLMELISTNTWKKNKLNILTGLQKLRQIAIHPQLIEKDKYQLDQSGKYQEVKRLLLQITRRGSKILIFSQFVKMLHLLRDDLEQEGICFNYLDGSTRNRQEQVETFQQNENIQVFLISLKAGGVGLNLTAADYVFILDPWWNPAVENQAIDRSHRIGQKKTVFYYKFITQNSIEEKILQLQQQKAKLSDDIISVEEDIYKSLDARDLSELLGS